MKLRAIWKFIFTVVILFQIKLAKKIVVSVEKELVWRKFITKKTWKVFLLWDQNLGNVRIDTNVIIFVFMFVYIKVLKIFKEICIHVWFSCSLALFAIERLDPNLM